MANTWHLNGGPMHDRRVALEEGRDHFHILESVEDAVERALKAPTEADAIEVVKTREGTYSVVTYLRGEMEWDGWLSHD